MNLKPQDILFLLKLIAKGAKPWTFSRLATELAMSASEVHGAAKRALAARLAIKQGGTIVPDRRHLEEFLLHGIQYVFVPDRGALNRGMPTAHGAEPLASAFTDSAEPPPVWPDPEGKVRGESFSPLYKSVPRAARNDPALYQLLVLVDAIRDGRVRESYMAKKQLSGLLKAQQNLKSNTTQQSRDQLLIAGEIPVSHSELKKLARRFHINRLFLFGSASRAELGPDSDIDLLVEFENDQVPSMGGMLEIKDAFKRLFHGRTVDIATPSILRNPYRKRAIERDMEELYAA